MMDYSVLKSACAIAIEVFFLIVILYKWISRLAWKLLNRVAPLRNLLNYLTTGMSAETLRKGAAFTALLAFFGMFFIQMVERPDFTRIYQNTDIIGVYGAVVGILALYGIYLGFLQFVLGDHDESRYLGRNKIRYLMDHSLWYQMTQTRSFLGILILLIGLPAFLSQTTGSWHTNLLFAWQASFVMSLGVYLFLISLSLKTIEILFLVHDHTDAGMRSIIRHQISVSFVRLFKDMYSSNFDFNSVERFSDALQLELKRSNESERSQILATIFFENTPLISEKLVNHKIKRVNFKKYGKRSLEEFQLDGFKKVLRAKWQVINQYAQNVNGATYQRLILHDMGIVAGLIKDDHQLVEPKKQLLLRSDELSHVNEYLIDLLVDQYVMIDSDMTPIEKLIENQLDEYIDQFTSDDQDKQVLVYYKRLEAYGLKRVLTKYLEEDSRHLAEIYRRGDETARYSAAVFEKLVETEFKLGSIPSGKYRRLIKSMTATDLLAYAFYVLLFPDRPNGRWVENLEFFKPLIKEKLWGVDPKVIRTWIEVAGEMVEETHIGHRVTQRLILKLYDDRAEIIQNMDYFDTYSRMRVSALLLLALQDVLNQTDMLICRLEPTIEDATALTVGYLNTMNRNSDVLKNKTLDYTMKSLIAQMPIHALQSAIYSVGVRELRYVEAAKQVSMNDDIIDVPCYFQQLVRHEFSDGESRLIFGQATFSFFVIKVLDGEYQGTFQDALFRKTFKLQGIALIDDSGLTVEEYLQRIYDNLKPTDFRIGKAKFSRIKSKAIQILTD